MSEPYCCDRLRDADTAHLRCGAHAAAPDDCPDRLVTRRPRGDWGLPYPPGAGGGYLVIAYCPFCGKKLP